MLRRISIGLLCAIAAYVIGAFTGGLLVSLFSSNTHDRGLEAAMTGAFFFGPLAPTLRFATAGALHLRDMQRGEDADRPHQQHQRWRS